MNNNSWSCKFTPNSNNVNKKIKNYKLKKILKFLKVYIKMEKQLQNLVIVKPKNTNFIYKKDLF